MKEAELGLAAAQLTLVGRHVRFDRLVAAAWGVQIGQDMGPD